MRKLMLLVAFLGFLGVQAIAQKTITGTVTSAEDGSALPGVSVVVKGTSIGTITDVDGKYTLTGVPNTAKTLVFSFVGFKTKEVPITGNVINVQMQPEAVQVQEVVVTALGVKRAEKTLPYTQQQVKGNELDIAQNINFESALAGKVAGVQIKTQPGSKLGYGGKVRIRGGLSLNSDASPLYIVDGVPADPNTVDVNDIASISVLKGPNATALYGQRAQNGVIIITTKQGEKGKFNVIINSSVTQDRVSYLPHYQNEYGEGYNGESEWTTPADSVPGKPYTYGDFIYQYPYWQDIPKDARFIYSTFADESWGPKYDGKPYRPWFTWWPTGPDGKPNPYFNKDIPYIARPNNVKDFYDDAYTFKNNIVLTGGTKKFTARVSFTNLNQNGIMPYTWQKRNTIALNFDYQFTKKVKVSGFVNFFMNKVRGDFNDGYANQTSGSFNQWFARDLDMQVERQLQGMRNPEGYLASWNWWNPYLTAKYGYVYGIDGFFKPVFWFNHYDWLRLYDREFGNNHLTGNLTFDYDIVKGLKLRLRASRNQNFYQSGFKMPYALASSAAPDLYTTYVNSFGVNKNFYYENDFNGALMFKHTFGPVDVDGLVGGNIRYQSSNTFYAWMNYEDKTNPLILPDVYMFSNATLPVTPHYNNWRKQVNSIYGRLSIGILNMLYIDGTVRRDWSSALPAENNGYTYPSLGLSFVFSQLIPKNDILTFGKFRAGWAQVGNDVAAQALVTTYGASATPFTTNYGDVIPLTYTPNTLIDPHVHPAINSSFETGFDLRLFKNRVGASITYYNELHKDDILAITIPSSTGFTSYLTNAGKVRRYGVELSLDVTPVKTKNFDWNLAFNFARNRSVIVELPAGMKTMLAPDGVDDWDFVQAVHVVGGTWGELQGVAILDTVINGKTYPVLQNNGFYNGKPNSNFGSVLPTFVGGFVNTMRIFNVNIAATFDFQLGGKFYSLSEFWGENTGLYAETAANGIREKGINMTGYFPEGDSIGTVNVAAVDYFKQFYNNQIAQPFIHDASYLKLRELSITYDLPKSLLDKVSFIKGASIGFIGRDLALLYVSKDNYHRWDPSELSHNFGENGQLPGVRSLGVYLRLKF